MSHGSNPMPPNAPKPPPPPNPPPAAAMPAGTRELIRAIEDNTAALRELIAMNAKPRTTQEEAEIASGVECKFDKVLAAMRSQP